MNTNGYVAERWSPVKFIDRVSTSGASAGRRCEASVHQAGVAARGAPAVTTARGAKTKCSRSKVSQAVSGGDTEFIIGIISATFSRIHD